MAVDRPSDWTGTVRDNWPGTQGFLLASTQPCLSIRDDELAAVRDNRVLTGVGFDDLRDWAPPPSWLLGVVLCPGDDVTPLVAWMRRRRRDADRVRFYLHATTPVEVLRPWTDAGLPVERVQADVTSWKQLHKRFGLASTTASTPTPGREARRYALSCPSLPKLLYPIQNRCTVVSAPTRAK